MPEAAFVSAETAWRMMTRRDPAVNILRATVAVVAAMESRRLRLAIVSAWLGLGWGSWMRRIHR